jgi:hypothetical protein
MAFRCCVIVTKSQNVLSRWNFETSNDLLPFHPQVNPRAFMCNEIRVVSPRHSSLLDDD